MALVGLAWALLAAYQGKGRRLLEKAQRQNSLAFSFYSMLAG